jgi:hypothetical protein
MDEEQSCESCPHVDVETNEPHGSPVQRSATAATRTTIAHNKGAICNVTKAVARKIYFDARNKSQSGKWIPLDKQTGLPYQCQ